MHTLAQDLNRGVTMSSKDYRRRETKKAKKDTKKKISTDFIPSATVEVIKKPKKTPDTTEE